MQSVRCAIAGMPQQLLVEILQNLAAESGRIQIVDGVYSVAELPALVASTPVDVLILGMREIAMTEKGLKPLHPELQALPIIGLDDYGHLTAFLRNAGREAVLNMILAVSGANDGGDA